MNETNTESKEPAPWVYEPGRSPQFQAWLDSLKERKVKKVWPYMPQKFSIKSDGRPK